MNGYIFSTLYEIAENLLNCLFDESGISRMQQMQVSSHSEMQKDRCSVTHLPEFQEMYTKEASLPNFWLWRACERLKLFLTKAKVAMQFMIQTLLLFTHLPCVVK